jgi:flagellin
VASGTATARATITGITVTDSLGAAVVIDPVQIDIGDTAAQITGKIAAAINAKIGETGLLATASDNDITFSSVKESLNASGAFNGYTVTRGSANTGTTANTVSGLTFAVSATANTVAPSGNPFFLDDLNIGTVVGAGRALAIVDRALTTVNGARADLGAVQNRFQSVVANLNSSSENLTASRSRIRDADYAKETAELTRTQILQQAGTAMLAQANQIPQNVLSLLR